MLSPQKNPTGDSQPPPEQPQLASNAKPENPPFFLRQHVLACRQRDVISNWPFPKKYLHLCLSYGIKEVLPPLESHKSALQSIRGVVSSNCAQQEDKADDLFQNKSLGTVVPENERECVLNTEPSLSEISIQYCPSSPPNRSHEREQNETNLSSEVASSSIFICSTGQPSATVSNSRRKKKNGFSPHIGSSSSVIVSTDQPSTSIQTTTTLSSIRQQSRKERRRNGKLKKRTMAAILDVAKPSTLEDLLRIKRLCCVSGDPFELDGEEKKCIIDDENNCESDLTKDNSIEKLEEECEAANLSTQSRQRLVVKFNFSGCKSNV
ncbi:uncharacterized protein LOC126791501 [Argentina anserina]|uniref:uncharacterized protein LOC126791501 n=1 Tax=Argentina anserina TaxID=57926 RepID=UPI0021763CB3|nr:uncharacterized protein LOC126791501 [Potentilla anserina]